jgi:DNA-binding transcriptional LysR family regulator
MSMELRDLRSFVTVVRTGSFTAAADELGYTQSAVSQQVAALEAELGRRLLERRPVRTTAAGAHLAEHAARILLRVDVAKSEVGQLAEDSAELVLVTGPLGAGSVLALGLRRFRTALPSAQLTVRVGGRSGAIAELASGEADVALIDGIGAPSTALTTFDAGLFVSSLVSESALAVILPADHPLARRRTIDLDVMVDAPWVEAPELLARPQPLGATPGGPPPLRYEGHDVAGLLGLVAAGHGAALLPARVGAGVDGVTAVPLGRPQLIHRIELLRRRRTSRHQRLLVDAITGR